MSFSLWGLDGTLLDAVKTGPAKYLFTDWPGTTYRTGCLVGYNPDGSWGIQLEYAKGWDMWTQPGIADASVMEGTIGRVTEAVLWYDMRNGQSYEVASHGTVEGTFYYWFTDTCDHSIFGYWMHDMEALDYVGPVRILPYTTVTWRSTGADWKSAGAYVLQWSELDFYAYDQLATLTDEELFYARNEMFWVHGYDFMVDPKDAELQKFFAAKSWKQEMAGEEFTPAERWNFALIRRIELDRKSAYADRGFTEM